jgi:chloride channel 3/4/5
MSSGGSGRVSGSATPIARPSLHVHHQDNWETIDTLHERDVAATQHIKNVERTIAKGMQLPAFPESQAVLSAILGGTILALVAVWIHAANNFMVSIRLGLCVNAFWLDEETCCPGAEGGCPQFVTWGEYFAGPNGLHTHLIDFSALQILGALGAVFSAILCKFYSPFASGGGINEVKTIVSGHVFDRYFSAITLVFKAVAVAMTTGCGLPVGKEGPFVHMGACVADLISGLFPAYENQSMRRDLITAGAGGGMAAAFGAPIGGVIFAIEEIMATFSFKVMIQTLIYGIVAVLVMKQFDLEHSGRIVQFSINFNNPWHWFELPLFGILGAHCGIAGSLMTILNLKWIRLRKATFLKNWPITEVFVLVVLSNTIDYFLPTTGTRGLLGQLADMIRDCDATQVANGNTACLYSDDLVAVCIFLLAAIIKLLMNPLAVGALIPSGVLVQSLVAGALFGRAFGVMTKSLQSLFSDAYYFQECQGLQVCVTPAVYAVVGSAAYLTGVTRMTVCLAVVMFELTGGLEYLVPVVVGIMCAKWAGEYVGVESTYEIMIEENKWPYIDPKFEFNQVACALDVIGSKKYVTLSAHGNTVSDLNDVLERNRAFAGFPVTDDDDTLLGYVSRKALVSGLKRLSNTVVRHPEITADTLVYFDRSGPMNTVDFSSLVDSAVLQVPPTCTLQRLLILFKSLGSRHVLVTNLSKFQGIITKKDLIAFFREVGPQH